MYNLYLQYMYNIYTINMQITFRAVRRVKGQKMAKIKNNCIRHIPYLRNSIAYDHDFRYTIVK